METTVVSATDVTETDCEFGLVSPSVAIVVGPPDETLVLLLSVRVTLIDPPSQPGSAMSPRTTAVMFEPLRVGVTVKPFVSQRAIVASPAPIVCGRWFLGYT